MRFYLFGSLSLKSHSRIFSRLGYWTLVVQLKGRDLFRAGVGGENLECDHFSGPLTRLKICHYLGHRPEAIDASQLFVQLRGAQAISHRGSGFNDLQADGRGGQFVCQRIERRAAL